MDDISYKPPDFHRSTMTAVQVARAEILLSLFCTFIRTITYKIDVKLNKILLLNICKKKSEPGQQRENFILKREITQVAFCPVNFY